VLIVLIPGMPLFPIMWLSQTLNAVFLPVLLVLILKLSNNEQLMGEWKNKRFQNILAGGLTIFISLVTVAVLVTSLWGWTP
jgi:Mn2+/Fe2+ NRAMP family transporter